MQRDLHGIDGDDLARLHVLGGLRPRAPWSRPRSRRCARARCPQSSSRRERDRRRCRRSRRLAVTTLGTLRAPRIARMSSIRPCAGSPATSPKMRTAGLFSSKPLGMSGKLGDGRGDAALIVAARILHGDAPGSVGPKPASSSLLAITPCGGDAHIDEERVLAGCRALRDRDARSSAPRRPLRGQRGRSRVCETSRWVSGICRHAAAAMPGGDAGHDLDRMPASRSASSSSPPRPKMNGSPPLSRTTVCPARARAIIKRIDLALRHAVLRPSPCRPGSARPRGARDRARLCRPGGRRE